MISKLLEKLLHQCESNPKLSKMRPLVSALDSFVAEVSTITPSAPFIRDGIDVKRIMMLVIFALIPCIVMAIVNSGVQSLVFGSGSDSLMRSYLEASRSFAGYFSFVGTHWISIAKLGLIAFIPVLMISYMVGGFWEVLFASWRNHEVSEGLLVTGILYALILPSTLPYWMVAVGVSAGIVIGKEIFGGTGMNILNPALTCRCFLYFAFPNKMTGDVWAGTNPTKINDSLLAMNSSIANPEIDGFSQTSCLNTMSIGDEIKRIHIDAIGSHWNIATPTEPLIDHQFALFQKTKGIASSLPAIDTSQLQSFVTAPISEGGLALPTDAFVDAFHFAGLKFGQGILNDANLFFGNMVGSFGETSTFACLLGALFLIITGVASLRTMIAVVVGTLFTGACFYYGSHWVGPQAGAFNPAKFDFPVYKQLLLGGLAFGLVFMATDPVSSPYSRAGKWIYGFIIGAMTIVIRLINPAFPEGVMLAILFGNVFAPLCDRWAIKRYRRGRRVARKA